MIGRIYRALGLLGWLGVLTLVAGAIVQHLATHLPAGYTWRMPYDTLGIVYGQEWVPTSFLVVALFGEMKRRAKVEPSPAGPWKPWALGAAVALVDVMLNPSHNAVDAGAIAGIGILAAHAPIGRERWQKGVAHFLMSAAVFAFVCYFFSVVKALTFVDRAQYDGLIVDFEKSIVGEYPHKLVAAWAATRPTLVLVCDWTYFRLFQHMALTTVLLTSMRQRTERFEYLGALAFAYTIGALTYHLLPAVGPAYYDAEAYRFLDQLPLSANPIRAQLFHYTSDVLNGNADEVHTWGYVACMPSLHIAHELVMLYYARRSRIAFALSAVFTSVTLLAVVVLGWHYFIDELGGLAVAAAAIALTRWQRKSLMPAALMAEPDEPIVWRPLKEWLLEVSESVPTLPALTEARAKKAILAIAAAGLVVRAVIGLRDLEVTDQLFVPDDAYTLLSLARSFAHGEAITHAFQPLIVLVTAPAFWATNDPTLPLVWILLVSILADAVSAWLLGSIARRVGGATAGVIAAAIWAASPLAIATCLDGLGTALGFMLQLAFVEAALRAKDKRGLALAGVFAGLALLASAESVFLILGLAVVLRRRMAPVAAVAAAVVLPWAFYAHAHFGAILPPSVTHISLIGTSLASQLGWLAGALAGGATGELPVLRSFLFAHPAVGIVVLLAIVAALVLALRQLRSGVVAAFLFHALAVAVVFAPTLWYARHFFDPVTGALALLVAVGAANATSVRARPLGLGALVITASFAVAADGHLLRGFPASTEEMRSPDGVNGFRAPAEQILARLPEGAVIGAFQSGALGYFAPPGVTVVNLDGSSDPAARKAIAERTVLDYAFERRLTFIAGWRVNIEKLRVVSAKSPRPFGAKPLGHVSAQGTAAHPETFTVYAVEWPSGAEVGPGEGP